MTLTRQTFNLIAATIRNSAIDPEARRTLAAEMATALSYTNSNFDRARFIRACDPVSQKRS